MISIFALLAAWSAQSIDVSPPDASVDERLAIRVSGVTPGEPVIVRASMADRSGLVWQSHAGFFADDNGEVDLARDAPANGDYSTTDSMGLIRSMRPPVGRPVNSTFQVDVESTHVVTFVLEIGARETGRAEVTRRFLREDVMSVELRGDGFVGRAFIPPEATAELPRPGIIVLGGSDGGWGGTPRAMLLASRGYVALSVAYFGLEGLPNDLVEIPIEGFVAAVDWLARQEYVSRIGILGVSKGAEAALVTASLEPRIRAVVAVVPSHVVWSGLSGSGSSWTWQGEPLPYVPPGSSPTYRPARTQPIHATVHYLHRLRLDAEVTERAAIPVERIRGPVLVLSGTDDQLWPSALMADRIVERLRRHEHPHASRHLRFDGAGHRIGGVFVPILGSTTAARGRLILGGTDAANARARDRSWPEVLAFLQAALD